MIRLAKTRKRSALLVVAAMLPIVTACGAARIDQKFTGTDKPEFGKDRYECMQRHDSTSNFIACMEAKGYKHAP